MTIRIGNAPCSWGVEFEYDPRNPTWREVLRQNAAAGYKGIELGPVGFMPEDPSELGDALSEHDLELIGGVVFRPYHDATAWNDVLDGTVRTCKALAAHGAKHLVLIDSISPRRAPTAGRADEPELERLLDEVDEDLLKICFDTGHHSYAGFDPVAFMKRHIGRISYMHFKDIDPAVKADVVAKRTDFYTACGQGIFCNLGQGDVDFKAVRQVLIDNGFEG